jgi:hypothetical protein
MLIIKSEQHLAHGVNEHGQRYNVHPIRERRQSVRAKIITRGSMSKRAHKR